MVFFLSLTLLSTFKSYIQSPNPITYVDPFFLAIDIGVAMGINYLIANFVVRLPLFYLYKLITAPRASK